MRGVSERVLVPIVGTLAVALLAQETLEGAIVAFCSFVLAALVVPTRPGWTGLLPFMRVPLSLVVPLLGTGGVAAIGLLTDLPGLTLLELGIVLAATAIAGALPYASSRPTWGLGSHVRVAVIGSVRAAADLSRELYLAGIPNYEVVGRIAISEPPAPAKVEEVATLGDLTRLGELVDLHRIDLLVMSSEAPRFLVFEEVSRSCLHLPVRLWELSGFYEDVFGHVPVAEINPAWFQYIMHPKYRAVTPNSKRALDIAISVPLLLVYLPVALVASLLIRRDGGPVFYKQVRIGEGGRPLTLYKFRTMRPESGSGAQWAEADDPRITRIGRLLRTTHLDELPQLFNVLRGEMSIVGPRPEQPEFVDRLEATLPFYSRRHLVKPGITGWAQVRCGYAGSDIGSAWKLSHDLYYIKHRSLGFDLAILGETFRTLFADRRYAIEPTWVPFIHGYRPLDGDAAGAEEDQNDDGRDPKAPPVKTAETVELPLRARAARPAEALAEHEAGPHQDDAQQRDHG